MSTSRSRARWCRATSASRFPSGSTRAAGVLQPLDEARVHEIARTLAEQDVVSVAVCLLHGYLNPVHERAHRRAAPHPQSGPRHLALLRRVSRSSASTSAPAPPSSTPACVRCSPATSPTSSSRLRGRGMTAELLIMQSSGGVLTFETGAEKPAYMVESGPAAGVIVANYIAGELGYANGISFDMGGTTAKVGLILDGQPKGHQGVRGGRPGQPGNGRPGPCQRLSHPDPGDRPGRDRRRRGQHRVGRFGRHPAGGAAERRAPTPGPICYGQGGEEPTITDANLTLGRLDPGYFLGGEMGLSVDARPVTASRGAAPSPCGSTPWSAPTASWRSPTPR